MGTSYPSGLDNFTNPTAADTLDSATVPHATQHANLNDAVEAIETELGTNPSGASATVVARLDALDTTVAAKIGSPLSASLDANSFDIYNVDQLALGGTISTAKSISSTRTATVSGLSYFSMHLNDTLTWDTAGFIVPSVLNMQGTYTMNAAPLAFYAVAINPSIGGSATAYTVTGFSINPSINASVTTARLVQIASQGSGTPGTTIGLDIGVTNSLTGTTKWGFQVGDYQSYHQGRLTLGSTSAPTYALDIKGTAQDRGVIALTESVATPTNPSASSQALIYMKADKLVIGYLDGATMRYKYLDLTSTGVTWTHTTVAP